MTPLYIFDLDGTLALVEHRQHMVERPKECQKRAGDPSKPCDCIALCNFKPDWAAFFAACVNDSPNWPVISTMNALLKSGADVQIWSGRGAEVMNETLAWIQRFITDIDLDEVALVMRREGDFTPDDQLKGGWLDSLSEFDRKRLVAVFDDRDKVVAMWRAKGVACFQVAPGAF